MKIGFNMLLWTVHVTQEHFKLFEKLKNAGYDGVEIPVLAGEVTHYEMLSKVLKDNGLLATTATIIQDEEHSAVSPVAKHRDGAVEYLKWVVDCSQALGADTMIGPFYAPVAVFTGAPPTEQEKQHCAEVHRKVADHAAQANVTLAVEFLNRFEGYFLNTMEDTANYVRRVGHPNFAAMFDTFHANIEEKDPIGCIGQNIDVIKHIHIAENDRGTPGKGHIDWPATFKAIRAAGYDNWLTVESFGRDLPEFAAATRCWRDFAASTEEVYAEGIKLIKEQWNAAG